MTPDRIMMAVNVVLAIGICVACLQMADRVNRSTRQVMRLALAGLFIGAGAQILGGWFEFGDWPQMVQLGSALAFMLGNMREPIALPSVSWANRAAWSVVGFVGCGFLVLLLVEAIQ